ncbi:MAG: ATP-binding protein [Bacteroidota bacterium]|nr:ATP-binding protein [Cytophagales bacterium]
MTKYRNTFYALKELINNSIQAKSTEIRFEIDYSSKKDIDSYIKSIIVRDNGHGVSISDFENKILVVSSF